MGSAKNEVRIGLYEKIAGLLQTARQSVVRTVNQTMVLTYFEIGHMIVEYEQNGKERADYGKQLLKGLSKQLTSEFGSGFSVDNLQNMRQLYLVYGKYETASRILEAPRFHLSWSHYLKLMRISDEQERSFYEIEAAKNSWSLKELQRQYDSGLYTRLSLSRNKHEILALSTKGQLLETPKDAIKDPYVLEFLGLPERAVYSESDLEQQLINKLEHFLLELGTGFTYVSRQKRITIDEKHFKIDLVFYNRILRAFFLVDLKIGELKHQDIGQMQMYVNYYDRKMRVEGENKTVGVILCQDKSEAVVRYTLPEDNEQIFASKYLTVLPSQEDLKHLIEEKKEINNIENSLQTP